MEATAVRVLDQPAHWRPVAPWAAGFLLAALGLQLSACTREDGVKARGDGTALSTPVVAPPWYEVVSHAPGPAVTDAEMRRRIEESGQPWRVRDLGTGIEMVLVMPGEFLMGSPEQELGRRADEGPQHRVRLTRAFYLGATEVTQAQWQHVTGASNGFFKGETKPADGCWEDLQEFLSQANAGLPLGVEQLRAPTEAEWEYACRAGSSASFSFEGAPAHEVLNFNDGVVKSPYVDGRLKVVGGRMEVVWEKPPSRGCRMGTADAGSLPPNAWGLHEMHGNLGEWTADKYSPDAYLNRGQVAVDPLEVAVGDDARTLRGGDWYKAAEYSRSARREAGGVQTRSNRLGFRVARTL